MAPFTVSNQGCLPEESLYVKSKISLSSSKHQDLCVVDHLKASIIKVKLRLWQAVNTIRNYCTSVTRLLKSEMIFFSCVGRKVAMMGILKKSGVEAPERPETRGKEREVENPEIYLEGKEREASGNDDLEGKEREASGNDDLEGKERESSGNDDLGGKERESSGNDDLEGKEREASGDDDDLEGKERESLGNDDLEGKERESSGNDDDDDEDDAQWGSDEETEDSDWSDDDDSEASAESYEIWESFLNNGDPYNPLSFCSSVGSRTNTQQKQQIKTQPSADKRLEESPAKTQPKNGGKKVCFSERVCVRPLLVWRFASRAARDGSCWLQMARDRERFKRRVQTLEPILKPCLMPEHRARVWERLCINTAS